MACPLRRDDHWPPFKGRARRSYLPRRLVEGPRTAVEVVYRTLPWLRPTQLAEAEEAAK